ncbi:hypothetical protein F0919_18025 [Taibaiella lutea]|uniref:Uncharacterized protein n=1 Tax=Taibaiella lutea TaxID=2608001 RepID=A0A5M6CHW1_9BACT|nr:hypothetical protein [Taibaiella lutea]KAA5532679.1 hypothetical protein F0919_18025 [Taibaiella lutea]
MDMKTLIIGIDPDVDASGVATINQVTNELELTCLKFFELYKYLTEHKDNIKLVVIEAGWLNKGNWHKIRGTANINAKIGERTGANFEVAKKISEMCDHLKVPFKEIKPLLKVWKGPDRKITAQEFEKQTGLKGRTNQEMRDAGLIALAYRKMK